MALNFSGVPNRLFDSSQSDNLGIGAKGKEEILILSPTAFTSVNPDVNNITIQNESARADADGITFYGDIQIPQGAEITEAIVYGNAAAVAGESWVLNRTDTAGNVTAILAVTSIGTANKNVTSGLGTVDNEKFSYGFATTTLDTNDAIYGARVTYIN